MKPSRRPQAEAPGPAEEYCAASLEILPAWGEEVWVQDPVRGRLLRLPEHQGALLPHLSSFRTLAGHAAALRQAGWQEDGSGFLNAVLRELVASGLLRSRSGFLTALQAAAGGGEAPPPIASVNWVTCSRLPSLRESLQGFTRSFLEAGRRPAIRVFDDSREPSAREAVRGVLSQLAKDTGLEVQYAGTEEKRSFAAELARSADGEGIPPELVEFALQDPCGFGYTVGANLNAFLLATQGELALKLDDDTFCRFASPLQPVEGLALESAPDPTQIRLFPDPEALAREVAWHQVDILQAHEILLGRSVAQCVARQGGAVRCDGVGTAFLQLLESRPAQVAATMAGVCGDSGMASARYFLALTGPERQRLVESEEGYRALLASRQLLRAAPALTLGPQDILMSMNSGFDNRSLLPPFFPGLYNSDGLFAVTLRACRPESLIGHLPLAAEHRPPEARRFEDAERRTLFLRLADLLILLVHSYRPCPVPSSPEAELQSLGRWLVALGSAQPAEFEALARRLWAAELSAYTLRLEQLLAQHQGEPEYWAEDVEAVLEKVAQQAAAPPGLDIVDLPKAGAAQGERASALVRRFGELLIAWPALVKAARRLQAAGTGICGKV